MGTRSLSELSPTELDFPWRWRALLKRWLLQPRPLQLGLLSLAVLLLLAIVGPFVVPYHPTKINMAIKIKAPSAEHWLGTDQLGRDVLTRAIYGVRLSMLVGLGGVLPAVIIGMTLGIVAGYFGGWLDESLMRLTDVFLSFPLLILAMGMSVSMGRGLPNATVAMVLTLWPVYARLVRSQALVIRTKEFVEAARSVGMPPLKIIWRHLVPNCPDAAIAQASQDLGTVIVVVASLSFLGMGAQPPMPEWGAMILEGRQYLREGWWISTFPGMLMFLVVTTFTLLGDGLRDRLDRGHGGVESIGVAPPHKKVNL